MEYWDIYDINRVKTGKLHRRGDKLGQGEYHLIVNVWIKNSNDEYLIQQRQDNIHMGGKWTCAVGGSAVSGEDSRQAIIRELKEEIGLEVSENEIKHIYTNNHHEGFNDIYFLEKDIDVETLVLQEEEVKDVRWVSKNELLEMISTHEFINRDYFTELFRLI